MNDIRVTEAHEFCDQQVEKLKAGTAEQGKPVTCRGSGCFACCYEPTRGDMREVLHMLDALTPEQRERVAQRTREWLDKVSPSGLLMTHMPNAFDWLALRAACPFLEDGKCMVYPRRPMACRIHAAIGDPDACGDLERRRTQKYVYSPELVRNVMLVSSALWKGHDEDHLGVWLAGFLLNRFPPSADRLHMGKECAKGLTLQYGKEPTPCLD